MWLVQNAMKIRHIFQFGNTFYGIFRIGFHCGLTYEHRSRAAVRNKSTSGSPIVRTVTSYESGSELPFPVSMSKYRPLSGEHSERKLIANVYSAKIGYLTLKIWKYKPFSSITPLW